MILVAQALRQREAQRIWEDEEAHKAQGPKPSQVVPPFGSQGPAKGVHWGLSSRPGSDLGAGTF